MMMMYQSEMEFKFLRIHLPIKGLHDVIHFSAPTGTAVETVIGAHVSFRYIFFSSLHPLKCLHFAFVISLMNSSRCERDVCYEAADAK